MRNHEKYVQDCAESIQREFPSDEIGIVLVDAGSSDRTVEKFVNFFKNSNRQLQVEKRISETFTLENFVAGLKRIYSSHFILLSCDDALGHGYGGIIEKILQDDSQHKTVYNVTLEICDEKLNFIGHRNSRWSRKSKINRMKLSIGNPGNAGGAILPTSITKNKISVNEIPKTLIEDYWLWWTLLREVNFKNLKKAKVLYRSHTGNVTKMKESKRYATSLGISAAIPLTEPNSRLNRFMALLLVPKWIRHIKFSTWPYFLKGYSRYIQLKSTKH